MSNLTADYMREYIKQNTVKEGKILEEQKYEYSGGRFMKADDESWRQGDVIADPENPFCGMSVNDSLKNLHHAVYGTYELSSYIALLANTNARSNVAALLPRKKDNIFTHTFLGIQIAEVLRTVDYGSVLTDDEYSLFFQCHTFEDLWIHLNHILKRFTGFVTLLNSLTFPSQIMADKLFLSSNSWLTKVNSLLGTSFASVSQLKQNTDAMTVLMNTCPIMLKNWQWSGAPISEALFGIDGSNAVGLRGSGTFTVPENIVNLNCVLISNGTTGASGQGYLKMAALTVMPGQKINWSTGATSIFGSLTTAGASQISDANTGIFLRGTPGGGGASGYNSAYGKCGDGGNGCIGGSGAKMSVSSSGTTTGGHGGGFGAANFSGTTGGAAGVGFAAMDGLGPNWGNTQGAANPGKATINVFPQTDAQINPAQYLIVNNTDNSIMFKLLQSFMTSIEGLIVVFW